MKTLTIYGFDDHLEQAINARAAQQNQSVSQWIVETLRHVLESDQESDMKTYHDLDHLAGGWSKEETERFLQNIQIFEKIDEDVWK
jgi:hypothetical protein